MSWPLLRVVVVLTWPTHRGAPAGKLPLVPARLWAGLARSSPVRRATPMNNDRIAIWTACFMVGIGPLVMLAP